MRILQVIPFFSPQMGGSAEVAYQVSKHLAQRGHAITVITTNYPVRSPKYSAQGVRVIEIPNWIAKFGFYFSPGLIAWAKENIGHFDIIHMHTARTFQNAVIWHFAIKNQVPFLLSAHGTLPVIEQRKFIKRIFDAIIGDKLISSASCLLAVSDVESEQYRQAGIPREKIKLIFNGLDFHEFENLPPRGIFRKQYPGIKDDTKLILFLGRIDKRKRIDHLINAYTLVISDVVDSRLVIAGPDEGELTKLKELVAERGISNAVIFTGPLYGRDKLAAYLDADVLVSPAIFEIFGLVPFEAMMCGTPVIIADDSGSGRLIKDTQSGFTFPQGDVDSLAKMVGYVLMNPGAAIQKVEAGQRFIRENLDWDKNVNKLIDLYQEYLH